MTPDNVMRLAKKILAITDCNHDHVKSKWEIESLLREAMRKEHEEIITEIRNNLTTAETVKNWFGLYIKKEMAKYDVNEAYIRAAEVARKTESCGATFPNCGECDCNVEIATAIEKLKEAHK